MRRLETPVDPVTMNWEDVQQIVSTSASALIRFVASISYLLGEKLLLSGHEGSNAPIFFRPEAAACS